MNPKIKEKIRQRRLQSSRLLEMSRIDRIKRPLALMVVMGKRNVYIAKQFSVTPQTVSNWLQDPTIQEAIESMTEEVHGSFERQYQVLFGQSLQRMSQLLSKSDNDIALEAIKTVWKSHGRLLDKMGGDTNIQNVQQMMGVDMSRDDAKTALEALRDIRDQNDKPTKHIEGSE